MPGALSGIRVVDFTEYIAGPYATMMLADMGADIVKVERPQGDAWRHTAPVAPYESRGFLGVNRGKRSIALDLGREEGRVIAQQLARGADVVVVNYRPGVAERLGLDYDSLSADNPALVYCENTAFGREGPYSGGPGYDILSQAATGMILYENKLERGTPQFIATVAVADLTTGMFMAFAIVNALYARAQTGRGQRIETSLFASGLAAQYRPLLSVEERDRAPREGFRQAYEQAQKRGLRFAEVAELRSQYIPGRGRNNYYRVYETKDGLIAVACLNNRQRRALRDALQVEDPSVEGMGYDWFAEDVRRAHKQAVEHYERTFRERPTAELIELLNTADVPCNRVRFPEELYDDPHVAANNLMLNLDHPVLGRLRMPACPIRMSETPAGSDAPPPVLGADGPQVLRELGYGDADIDRLLEDGILHTRERLLDAEQTPEG
ncbi:MAG: CoA transferase [Chloroflexi bacterium]|nr:CoA transferase [Chloroflexota bacterium]